MELVVCLFLLAAFIVGLVVRASTYNRIVELSEEIEEAKENLIADYNNRMSLVQKVDEIAEAAVGLDEKMLTKVIEARRNLACRVDFDERLRSESTLSKEIGSAIMFINETYPTVSSMEIYRDTIKTIREKTESIQAGIRILNANIRSYNVYRQSFLGQTIRTEHYPRRIEYPSMRALDHEKLIDLLPESHQGARLLENKEKETDNGRNGT